MKNDQTTVEFSDRHIEARKAVQERVLTKSGTMRAMLPEIRARAFAVSGIEDMRVLAEIRAAVEGVASGDKPWREARTEIAAELHGKLAGGKISKRAELVVGQNARMAWAATRYQQEQEDKEVFPYLMYQSLGDQNVRDEHRELDGKVLHKDDPFWQSHYPPWDWGCRCTVIELTEEEAREKGVWSDTSKKAWTKNQPGKDPNKDFEWSPGSLKLPLGDLIDEKVIGAEEMRWFGERMRDHVIEQNDGRERNVWEWLWDGQKEADRGWLSQGGKNERVMVRDAGTGKLVVQATGDAHGVTVPGDPYGEAARQGRELRGHHYHASGDPTPSPQDVMMALNKASAAESVFATGGNAEVRVDKTVRHTKPRQVEAVLEQWQRDLESGSKSKPEWTHWLKNTEGIKYEGPKND